MGAAIHQGEVALFNGQPPETLGSMPVSDFKKIAAEGGKSHAIVDAPVGARAAGFLDVGGVKNPDPSPGAPEGLILLEIGLHTLNDMSGETLKPAVGCAESFVQGHRIE